MYSAVCWPAGRLASCPDRQQHNTDRSYQYCTAYIYGGSHFKLLGHFSTTFDSSSSEATSVSLMKEGREGGKIYRIYLQKGNSEKSELSVKEQFIAYRMQEVSFSVYG